MSIIAAMCLLVLVVAVLYYIRHLVRGAEAAERRLHAREVMRAEAERVRIEHLRARAKRRRHEQDHTRAKITQKV